MAWLAFGLFSELSVKVALPVAVPAVFGSKLMLKLHAAPGASEKLAVQSGNGPDPGTCTNPAEMLNPGVTALSGSLPIF